MLLIVSVRMVVSLTSVVLLTSVVTAKSFAVASQSQIQLRIAVASNFLQASRVLANQFEQQSGIKVNISSGSSGKLYHQIMHGAPFDLFLSADTDKPIRLIKSQHALESSLFTYAKGQLVLWVKNCPNSNKSAIDLSLKFLTQEPVKKLAIANPKLAPYGVAASELIKSALDWQQIGHKLVYPENIAQVAQLAKLGVVDAAFVAKSHSESLQSVPQQNHKSCLIELDSTSYPPIKQQLVILKATKNSEAAEHFLQFMRSPKAQALIKNMGYLTN